LILHAGVGRIPEAEVAERFNADLIEFLAGELRRGSGRAPAWRVTRGLLSKLRTASITR
jgi:hypothetical protein